MPGTRQLRRIIPHWPVIFGAILLAWAALFLLSAPSDLRETARIFGGEFWVALCTVTPDGAGFLRSAGMWALMSTAMMLPTALGAIATYGDIGQAAPGIDPTRLVAGFLAVWFGFSVLAAGLQIALLRADLVSAFGDSRSPALSAALLALSGAYQFSATKAACLTRCRRPLTFFLEHWSDGPWRMGLRLGATCLGCCWALMLLAFVGGMMSLAFMGLATLIMTLEKMPEIGARISAPLGVVLLAAAGWTAFTG